MMTTRRRRRLMLRLIDEGVLDLDLLDISARPVRARPARLPTLQYRQPEHYVYVFKSNNLYKIGRSINPTKRALQLQTGSGSPIELVYTIKTRHPGLERGLHQRFTTGRKSGEWFDLSDADLRWIEGFASDNGHYERLNLKC